MKVISMPTNIRGIDMDYFSVTVHGEGIFYIADRLHRVVHVEGNLVGNINNTYHPIAVHIYGMCLIAVPIRCLSIMLRITINLISLFGHIWRRKRMEMSLIQELQPLTVEVFT